MRRSTILQNLTEACARASAGRVEFARAYRMLVGLTALAAPSMAFAIDPAGGQVARDAGLVPSPFWILPFAALLLAIAVFPLVPAIAGWWHHNRNRLLVAVALGLLTLIYYAARGYGFHDAPAGFASVKSVLHHAIIQDYVPFIVLLFSLYVISGGIRLSGDIPAHPFTNVVFILIGAVLASFIGTTGASMLLIRPLLQVNSERKHVTHTVVFFIFLVSNIGGCLLPIGDPPLFLGYLRGVPFTWTLGLWKEWAIAVGIVLAIYWVIDHFAYQYEDKPSIALDERRRVPLRLEGLVNIPLMLGVILAVAILVPGKPLIGTEWVIPGNLFLREWVQMGLAGMSMLLTSRGLREANDFNFSAIAEVAALFIGIFITMQVPIEILHAKGASLGLQSPLQFFWATGALSSVLDNAPTYVVFFTTALALPEGQEALIQTHVGMIREDLLVAISLGSVFMGAMTYIGNGPNFLVKSIAESRGIKMPSFFGYMLYSIAILIPIFVLLSYIFFIH